MAKLNQLGVSRPGGGFQFLTRLDFQPIPVFGLLVISAALVGLWPAFDTMKWWWAASRTYSHGYLIIAISGYFLFKALARPWASSKNPVPVLIALVAALAVWILGYEADIEMVVMGLLPLVMALAIMAAAGLAVTKASLFPLGFLYFGIPAWEFINTWLQSGTVLAMKLVLPAIGVSALIEGNYVLISAGNFEIAGGCSGLHYLIVSLALAVLYGYLYLATWRRRLVLCLVAFGLALITNWVRVATIIYAGDVSNMQHYLIQGDHINFGWAMFGVSLFPLLLLAGKLRPSTVDQDASSMEQGAVGSGDGKSSVPIMLITLVLLLFPAIFWMNRDVSPIIGLNVSLPRVDGWLGPVEAGAGWNPLYPGASGESLRQYSRDKEVVDVYANVYLNQTRFRELIGYPNVPFGERYLRVMRLESVEVSVALGEVFNARQVLLADARGNQRLVLYWYVIGRTRTADDRLAKGFQAAWGLVGNHDAGLVSMSSECEAGCEQAAKTMVEFAGKSGLALEHELLSARSVSGDRE